MQRGAGAEWCSRSWQLETRWAFDWLLALCLGFLVWKQALGTVTVAALCLHQCSINMLS